MTGLDRAVGALLGLACGDATGTTLEFRAPGSFEPISDMVGGGPFHLKPGEWTDDTSMALCLAESILDTGTLDLADQMRRYLLWRGHGYLSSNGRCFDIGNTTRYQLDRFRDTGAAVDPKPDEEAAANGSLMRLAPVPVRWHTDPGEAAERSGASSRSTHAARRPVDTCRVLGAMIAALISGTSEEEVFAPDFWAWGDLHAEVEAVTRGSWRQKQPSQVRGTGYCVDALEAALWAVGGADDFATSVLRAANLGDDADTTAAIAGQLAGARWGSSGIPSAWKAKVVAAERIEAMATGLFAAGGGDVGAPAWPHDEFIHAWWVIPGLVLAGEYPGNPDPRRARAKVDLLIDAGVRTFVDLTTPDDHLLPYQNHLDDASKARRVEVRREEFPIPDRGVVDDDRYDDVLRMVTGGQGRGVVYVHCWGGVGRTGTVVGCLLADQNPGKRDVLETLEGLRVGTRKAHRGCPENGRQLGVLRRRAARTDEAETQPPGQERQEDDMTWPLPIATVTYPRDSDLEDLSSEELVEEAEAVGFQIDPDDGLTRREIIDTIIDFRADYAEDADEMNSETKAELIAWADSWGYHFRRSGTKAEIIQDLRGYW